MRYLLIANQEEWRDHRHREYCDGFHEVEQYDDEARLVDRLTALLAGEEPRGHGERSNPNDIDVSVWRLHDDEPGEDEDYEKGVAERFLPEARTRAREIIARRDAVKAAARKRQDDAECERLEATERAHYEQLKKKYEGK